MSEQVAAPAAATAPAAEGKGPVLVKPAAAPAPAPAKPKNAIQILEEELLGFFKQREQLIANSHAVEGAIQAAQLILGKLKAEAQKAEAEAKKLLTEAGAEIGKVADKVETAVESAV